MPKLRSDYLGAVYQALFEIEYACTLGFNEAYRADVSGENNVDQHLSEEFRRIGNDVTDIRYFIEKHEACWRLSQNKGLADNRIKQFDRMRAEARAAKGKKI